VIKEIEYKVPITRSEVIGEETKTEKIKCCDKCGAYSNIYIEMKFTGKYESVPTGRESPCNIFHHYTTKGNGLSKCIQCHGDFCETCMGYNEQVWDSNDDHIGPILLCESCNENRSNDIKELIEFVEEKKYCQALLNEVSDDLVRKYTQLTQPE
jgi:hypothetical protein